MPRLRTLVVSAAMLFAASGAVQAAPIAGLFNTGVDGVGSALTAGSADPHYTILSPDQPAIVIRDSIPGTWLPNTATRRWIWQDINGNPTNVIRTFRTTFDLTGLDAGSASISGQWATDNGGLDILINGNSTGNTCGGFTSLCGFSVLSGFVNGLNTLDFVVQDVGSISGFLVSSISGTADELGVPSPAAYALFALGLFGLAAGRRNTGDPARG